MNKQRKLKQTLEILQINFLNSNMALKFVTNHLKSQDSGQFKVFKVRTPRGRWCEFSFVCRASFCRALYHQ